MSGCFVPNEKNDPVYQKLEAEKKKKVLELAEECGCYEEAKKCYAVMEIISTFLDSTILY